MSRSMDTIIDVSYLLAQNLSVILTTPNPSSVKGAYTQIQIDDQNDSPTDDTPEQMTRRILLEILHMRDKIPRR